MHGEIGYAARELVARVRDMANQIPDPCGLAQSQSIGMADMGLLRAIEAVNKNGAWSVTIRARVTSPECLHFVYFERELRAALRTLPEIGEVHVEWDNGLDWTPEDMNDVARARLRERRNRVIAAYPHSR